MAFDVEASAALAGDRDLVVAFQLFGGCREGDGRFLDWASCCTFGSDSLGEEAVRRDWPVSQQCAAGPLGGATHACLADLSDVAGGGHCAATVEALAALGAGKRGGFEDVELAPTKTGKKGADGVALRLPVGAALSAAPVNGPPPPPPPRGAPADEDSNDAGIEERALPWAPDGPGHKPLTCVYYHLVYDADAGAGGTSNAGAAPRLASRVDRVDDATCAWCAMACGGARGLVAHLVAHHSPQLRFEALLDDRDQLHVVATPAELARARPPPDQGADDAQAEGSDFVYLRATGAPVPLPVVPRANGRDAAALRLAAAAAADAADDADARAAKPGAPSQAQRAIPPPTRQYYHARTSAPIAPELLATGYDSDDDVDESWRLRHAEKLLDEFEDVTLQEKAFMKLWNKWVFRNPIQADRNVPRAVAAFAEDFASQLARQNLRHNFLLHLFHLWDNSLLAAQHITDCLAIVDAKAAAT